MDVRKLFDSVDALVLDLDGTLVGTEDEYVVSSMVETLEACRYRKGTPELARRIWFEHNRAEILEGLGIQPTTFWEAFTERDTAKTRREHISPYADVVGFLDAVQEYKLGIVTGASQRNTDMEVSLLGRGRFDSVVCANMKCNGIQEKPHPEGVIRCLDELGVEASRAVMVGNGSEDITAGSAAGTLTCYLDRGEHRNGVVKPTISIHSLDELRPYGGGR